MNERNQTTQLAFFESELPDWNSLSHKAQQSILDVLSKMLLDVLDERRNKHITTIPTTNRDQDVRQN